MTHTKDIIAVYVTSGTRARRLEIRGTLDKSRANKYLLQSPERLEPFFPGSIATRFATAVTAGCLGPPGVCEPFWLEKQMDDLGVRTDHLRIDAPPLPTEAFGPLVGMAAYALWSDTGLVSFQVMESALLVEEVDANMAKRLPAPDTRFPLVFPSHGENGYDESSKDARVVVTFASPASDETYARTAKALEAWAGLLCGGFPAKRTPMTAGFFVDVSRHLPNEVVLEVEQLYGSKPAWDALLRALDVIDRELQPIERVEAY